MEKLVVRRGFGLTAHLIALEIGQSCHIPTEEYTPNVIYVTISRLNKKGYNFKTKRKKPSKKTLTSIRVTR